MTRPLSATQEDYVETIFRLAEENRVARVKDIAAHLGVHKSSVTGALRSLSEMGLVNYEPYGYITLTAVGEQRARRVLRRHEDLQSFLTEVLGLDDGTAEDAACKMEHTLPDPVVDRFIDFDDYIASLGEGEYSILAPFKKRHANSKINPVEL